MPLSALALIPQLPSLDKIKYIRKKLGISQRDLAKCAGVSQSLIAKIESGSVDPSYENVCKIFTAFEKIVKNRYLDRDELEINFTVGDLASKQIISVSPDASVVEAVELMLEERCGQLPVMVKERLVGSITEDRLKDYIVSKCNSDMSSEKIVHTKIKEIMGPPFTVLDERTPIEIAAIHLHHEEAVLVRKNGVIAGILTSTNYLGLGTQ